MLRRALPISAVAALAAGAIVAFGPSASASVPFAVESLDGGGNNTANPTWGQAGRAFGRVGPARYADGISQPVSGPNARQVSNRIFNDQNQDVFTERRLSQWAWQWGQFLDHTFTLRDGGGSTATPFNIDFQAGDPMESFSSNLGVIAVNRSAQAPGTGTSTSNPRQQTNLLPSYISANPVYGDTNARLDWLRNGPVDGDPTNNQATLMMSANNYLPRATARGDASTAPAMDHDGRLAAHPQDAMVAGDPRANENLGLTATQTLFAREHNRIVSLLPNTLSEEDKFQIARRVVIAEEQYITYQEWLPAMGVALPKYTGYKSGVNSTISNEFATVSYRAHSQIHGEFELDVAAGQYSQATLDTLQSEGVEINLDSTGAGTIAIPLGVAFFNPDVLEQVQLGPMLLALGEESQYNNDETIDNQLRSVLFQVPVPGNNSCLNGPTTPQCFTGVNDLAAIDIQRGRDHGTGSYNQIRQAYGLQAKSSFTAITGENTDAFPSDPLLTAGNEINDPNSIDVTKLFDIDGNSLTPGTPAGDTQAVRDVRRTTIAARLKAIYGSVDKVDAFTGVYAEPHVPGTEFGETNLAIWTKQFTNLRDGDRFYFGNDQGLSTIKSTYGIDFKKTLAQVIAANTDATTAANVHDNVFLVAEDDLPATACSVLYTITPQANNTFTASIKITNNTNQAVSPFKLKFELAQGQALQSVTVAAFSQSTGNTNGRDITVFPAPFHVQSIPAGGSITPTFTATYDGLVNAIPPNFSLNGRRCSSNHS